MAEFEIYIPANLSFQDYIAIIQTARVWADGYDKKVPTPSLYLKQLEIHLQVI